MVAVAEDGTDRSKLRANVLAPSALELGSFPTVVSGAVVTAASREGPLKLPLQTIYCRWTV
jgi:hypothetical protein